MTKNNISKISDCYGCGVCAISCNQNIIEIKANEDGFYAPFICDKEKCTECGNCLKVCAYANNSVFSNHNMYQSFAGWSKDEQARFSSTSGGICYELCKYVISQGYKVIAVEYDVQKHIAQHYVATDLAELERSKTSKYIPSYTLNAFSQINKHDKYLVVSTPCHIDSLRRYIKKFKIEQNFILIDFFCHGISSLAVWKKYLQMATGKTGKITRVQFRNKSQLFDDTWANMSKPENYNKIDWHDSLRVKVWGEEGNFQSSSKQRNSFFYYFLFNRSLGKACYDSCRFKMLSSSADIRVGDYWGRKYADNRLGVNSILVFTQKGNELIKETKNIHLQEHSIDDTVEGQMKRSPIRPKSYNYIRKTLKTDKSLTFISFIADIYDGNFYLIHLFKRIINKIKILTMQAKLKIACCFLKKTE